jgi:Sulfotransferase domain
MSAAPLPGFIVIGAMRAATTTLHRYLGGHPAIGMSRRKETDFFVEELNLPRGQGWYRSLFPRGRAVCGETSPNYTKFDIFPGVPERIRRQAPGCKLIYIVRDPVARAVSHHRFAASLGTGRDTPEPDRLQHMTLTSSYFRQLERYLEHFSLDDILVLDFDELAREPLGVLARAGRFLGVPDGWGGLGQLRANGSDELARMPGWYFRLRRSRLATGLATHLPPDAADRLRRAIARPEATDRPTVHPDAIQRFRDDLADDAARFRALTGLPFAQWSV